MTDRNGMGQVIFLSGVTSSGKTSLAKAIQAKPGGPYYLLSNDLFQQTVGEKDLQADYWTSLGNAIILMYHTARMFAELGQNVIIDGMLLDEPCIKGHVEKMKRILDGVPMLLVHLSCPLPECRRRNLERGDRQEGQSEWQSSHIGEISYDLTVDTMNLSPEQCAEIVLNKIAELI